MYDQDVREATLKTIRRTHRGDSDTLIIEELGLHYGDARVDIAIVNGVLHGLEIKSDHDTLHRLSRQASIYNAILDQVTIVCGERHLVRAQEKIPDWWGVMLASEGKRGIAKLHQVRLPSMNPEINPLALASLLWRDETLSLLEAHGAARGVRGKSKLLLAERLAETLTLEALGAEVRAALKSRQG